MPMLTIMKNGNLSKIKNAYLPIYVNLNYLYVLPKLNIVSNVL